MANKVLDLLWSMAHSEDAPTEIIEQAVAAHVKILDYRFIFIGLFLKRNKCGVNANPIKGRN